VPFFCERQVATISPSTTSVPGEPTGNHTSLRFDGSGISVARSRASR
jgi:hypothetical protein